MLIMQPSGITKPAELKKQKLIPIFVNIRVNGNNPSCLKKK